MSGIITVGITWDHSKNGEAPPPKAVFIHFMKSDPDLWEKIMTEVVDGHLGIFVFGTRNQNHDGLDPEYVKLLPKVNEVRKQRGLSPVTR